MPDPAGEITITRVFDAPRELVFRSWTEPAQLASWFGPRNFTTPLSSVSMDVRPGGEWSACMVSDADGGEHWTGGVYREVVEPERLVFTWRDPGDGREFREDSVVTVVLVEVDGKTEMTFRQTGFTTGQGRANVCEGWSSSFDCLLEYVTRS